MNHAQIMHYISAQTYLPGEITQSPESIAPRRKPS